MNIAELQDDKLCTLIDNRYKESATVYAEIERIYGKNKAVYTNEAPWVQNLPETEPKITNGRIFTNTESVINSVINNPPKPNVIPNRADEDAIEVAGAQEKFFTKKYELLNVKETLRRGLRDLYFGKLMVIKPFWNNEIDDIDVKRIDPRKVRFSALANNESESEFAIEDVDTTVAKLIERYPSKEKEILEVCGKSKDDVMIENIKTTYQEVWFDAYLCIKYKNKILWKGKNPYWDFDGVLLTKEELNGADDKKLKSYLRDKEGAMADVEGEEPVLEQEQRRKEQSGKRDEYDAIKKEGKEVNEDYPYESYLFNHFDRPRKPYIFVSILKNEDGLVGNTSFIEMATPLAETSDRLKRQIYKNALIVNGIIKVDSDVMPKEQAQTLLFQTGGIIHGKGVVAGVQRETGTALPSFVFDDMNASLNEIDNIMGATSAFRGEREGTETRAGRLALIDQSYLRLNELVQAIDYVSQELFNWWYQLARVRYTEAHYIKDMGEDKALETIEFTRHDFEKGSQIRIIPGKTLPEDREFKFDRAQEDMKNGYISPLQYLKDAGYENPREIAREAYEYQQNPASVLGIETPMTGEGQGDMTMPNPEVPMAPPEMAPMTPPVPQPPLDNVNLYV